MSRGAVRRRRPAVVAGLLATLVVIALAGTTSASSAPAASSPSPAVGALSSPTAVESPSAGLAAESDRLALTVDRARVELGPAPVAALRVAASPSSIAVGIPCGMEDMCGGDPCLCGAAVDHWGACACNGLQTIAPSVTVTSSDQGVVRVVSLGGTHWLVPCGTGRATVIVTGSLAHYRPATTLVPVTVGAGALLTLGLTIAAVVTAIVALALVLRRARRARRARRSGGDPASSDAGGDGGPASRQAGPDAGGEGDSDASPPDATND